MAFLRIQCTIDESIPGRVGQLQRRLARHDVARSFGRNATACEILKYRGNTATAKAAQTDRQTVGVVVVVIHYLGHHPGRIVTLWEAIAQPGFPICCPRPAVVPGPLLNASMCRLYVRGCGGYGAPVRDRPAAPDVPHRHRRTL